MRHNYCSLFPRDLISRRGYFYIFQLRSQLESSEPMMRAKDLNNREGNETSGKGHLTSLLSALSSSRQVARLPWSTKWGCP